MRKWRFTKTATTLVCLVFISWTAVCDGLGNKGVLKAKARRTEVASHLVKTAWQYNGLQELTGHNDHPQISEWMAQCGLDGDKGYAWCAAAQTGIHNEAGISNPGSARVVDWFRYNVTWKRQFGNLPKYMDKRGMVGAIYYNKLGRYGHIVLIIRETENNFYTLEGNTSPPKDGESLEQVVREALKNGGFYRKIRNKKYIAALADYCVSGQDFVRLYDNYLQESLK